MKVLVGVDGSPNSFAAVEFVSRLISPKRDELILFYAAPLMSFEEAELLAVVVERAKSLFSQTIFEQASERLPEPWRGRAELVEVIGPPASTLLATAEERGVELIVVGFRGLGLLERVMLGSVCRAVAYSAPVPVLVVKTEPNVEGKSQQLDHAARGAMRLLAACDGPEIVPPMAGLLGRFTWPADSEGWLTSVVEPMFAGEMPGWLRSMERDPEVEAMAAAWQKEHEQHVDEAREELRGFQGQLPELFSRHEPIVAEGRPSEVLVETLKELGVTLAVVGSRSRGPVARLLLGSTCDSLLTYGPCSVLIVR